MTYKKWIENWVEQKSPMVKESTFAVYSNILVNHLLPKFGELERSEITEERMQEYVFSLVKEGRLDGRGGLNPRSAKDVLIVLKTTLRDAMRAKELPRMIYDGGFVPKTARHSLLVGGQTVRRCALIVSSTTAFSRETT